MTIPGQDTSLQLLLAGDPKGEEAVFYRFANRLVGLARSRLDKGLRRKVDPEDVVQSAFRSFFRRHEAGTVVVRDWDSLWSLLTIITMHKCGHQVRYFKSGKRNLSLENSSNANQDDSVPLHEALAKEPTPPQAAMLTELLESLSARLNEKENAILELTLQGFDPDEISAKVGRSLRTVRRVVDRIRHDLESQLRSQ